MDTGAPLGLASVAALVLSPVWPDAGLAGLAIALLIAAFAAARTARGLV